MYCSKCGKNIPDNSQNCNYCGAPTNTHKSPSQPYTHEDTSPLSMGNFFVMMLIAAIPIVNIIILCVWAFGSDVNVNRKNYARAQLIIILIAMLISIWFWGSLIFYFFSGYGY